MNRKGFTLIELVMIIVLIGILATFIAPRTPDVGSTKGGVFTDKLRADIRYAQNLAMTKNRRTQVYFNGTGPAPVTAPLQGYSVGIDSSGTGDCSVFALAMDPAGEGALTVTLMAGNYAGVFVAPSINCLEYDSLGRPYTCGVGSCSTIPLAAAMTADVNNHATMRVAVSIQTGAVN
jgi:prepilin-type N-terminal cleavage/methylation domain-containing protein